MPPFVIRIKIRDLRARRFVVSVSKKVLKKAVDRNLVKRRFRAILLPFVKKNKNRTIMIIAKQGILETSFRDLKDQIEKTLPSYL